MLINITFYIGSDICLVTIQNIQEKLQMDNYVQQTILI